MSLAQNLMSQSISRSDFCVSAVVIVVVDDKEKEEIVDNVVKVDKKILNTGRLTWGLRGGCQAGHGRGRYQGEGRRQCIQDKVVLDWFSNNVFRSELFSPCLSSLSYHSCFRPNRCIHSSKLKGT